jgi:4-hydroxymandelate oxidase
MMLNINTLDYENNAKKVLSQTTWDYYSSGAWDETTLQENLDAFKRFKLRPRVLVDVSQRNLQTTILGQPIEFPILLAPTAFHCLAHPDGELATANAANQTGTMMILSTLSTKSIEEVAEVRTALNPNIGQIFQLYVHRDRELTRSLVERAYAAGFCAICLTVDTPMLGKRERDSRNQFTLPPELELANFRATKLALSGEIQQTESGLFTYVQQQISPAITWDSIDWLASISPLPIIIKGILRGDDAIRSIEHGAKAIICSNHGGRQLDGAISTMDALEEVVTAVDGRCEVLVDGGIRRGVDILKALSFGAKAVLIGRPVLWGLSVGGAAGVAHVLEILKEELDLAMALSGCTCLSDIDRDLCSKL